MHPIPAHAISLTGGLDQQPICSLSAANLFARLSNCEFGFRGGRPLSYGLPRRVCDAMFLQRTTPSFLTDAAVHFAGTGRSAAPTPQGECSNARDRSA